MIWPKQHRYESQSWLKIAFFDFKDGFGAAVLH